MARWVTLLAFSAAMLGAGAVGGQELQAIKFEGSPGVLFDSQGRVNACTLRVFGMEAITAPQVAFRSVDVSLLLSSEGAGAGVGMVKASSVEAAAASMQSGKPSRVFKVTDGWLRTANSERTVPHQGKVLKSAESPSAYLYLAKLDVLLKITDAILDGQEVQASVKRGGFSVNPVYYGTVEMTEQDRKQFLACLGDLVAAMERLAGQPEK